MVFPPNLIDIRNQAFEKIQIHLGAIDKIAEHNTSKVLEIFRKHQVSDFHFRTTTGYGYDDAGREKLDNIWADICGTEAAIVRSQFVSGTHALATVLFGILRPGDELVSVTGAPYDTMQTVIGHPNLTSGSLREFGISYKEIEFTDEGVDFNKLHTVISARTKMVLIQRSRGYSMRKPLTIKDIEAICKKIKSINKNCICFVDNCYGEFVEILEPTAVGADIMAGSLIKNPGGGLAPTGGYIAGKRELVELAATRLTAPGIGSELGASLVDNRLLYQGIFLAPHIVAQALKGAVFSAAFFSLLGYKTTPAVDDPRSDIIQAIELGSPDKMVAFCIGLQKYSPVNAHFRPEPSLIPGYADPVVMAAGTFVQGASIELSADGPIRAPYIIYLQGGLTLEHCVLGSMSAAAEIIKFTK